MRQIIYKRIDTELRNQKTLVPGVESQWIICRNDPVNKTDADGNSPLNWLLRKIGVPALKGGLKGAIKGGTENTIIQYENKLAG